MANSNRELLQREIEHYTNLLKKYESYKNIKLHSQNMQQLPGSSCWKQPVLPVHKAVANSTHSSSSPNPSYSFNKLHSSKLNSGTIYQNNKTVLYNQNNNFKAKYKLGVQSHISRSIKIPAENINERLLMNKDLSNKYKMTLPVAKTKIEKPLSALSNASKNIPSSNSQVLMKEITDVIKQLKTKSKIMCSNTKDTTSKQTIANNCNFTALNKCKTVGNDNQFSKNNAKSVYKISSNSCTNSPTSVAFHKLNAIGKTNASSNHRSSLLTFNKEPPKAFNLSKYAYENDEKQRMKLKLNNFPLKEIEAKHMAVNTEKKVTAISQLSGSVMHSAGKVNVPNTNILPHGKASSVQPKTAMLSCHVTDKKLDMIKESSKYKVVRKEFVNLSKVKSPVISNMKTKTADIYSKVNKRNSVRLNKTQQKNSNVYHRTPLSTKRMKKKVNLKYKVINRTNSCLNKKVINVKNNERSKENSPLLLDKSDPLYELLHESSTIDKLEQELLAKSSSLTNTPKPAIKENQIGKTQITFSSVNPKFCLKKTPLKRPKLLSSKYKVINKTLKTPQNYSLKSKSCTPFKNSAKKLCNKVVCSKFAVINKHSKPTCISSPMSKGKFILVKRLYKSKNTIINKNSSPSNLSAKIKSKYLALSKRRPHSWQKHFTYLKGPARPQKFKGYYGTNRLRMKHLRYRKTSPVYHQKVTRKFPCYRVNNQQFNTNRHKNIWLKKKSIGGQVESNKTQKRIVIGGKSYIKAGNTLKALSPSSTNLASRALHRSINRVLTASTKKSLTKVSTYCMFYNRFGRCNRGVKCTYIHDPSKIAVCTRFLRGTCKIDGCPFSHEVSPGKMAICSFFLLGSCEKENCPYRHEKLSPDAELCKAFVQGYCPNGKECKKAHILICPKFIQGECEKGSSCAYPHPPQKAKKNVQKDVMDDKDNKKFEDIWLEKVARYFQPCEELPLKSKIGSNENETVSQVLPKRKRIEEQPSFIPLCDTPGTSRMEKSCPVDEQENKGGIHIA